ncbi:hypothetical protein [Aporhodopirellula aestuarii]|uniref:Uncharacterized protein n=1 Tax=Aporhodopirellula aestuarii TaxID=2950107 RepID=A0ABT0TZA8_9BACT|nr:hypothetical protein [Aporhodopirellula aestuarii]MCM2369578.1 hypothetical protein [Aporhodopirellula aestuarii]
MPNELPLPAELMHLIEKRSGTDRRKTPADAPGQAEDLADLSTTASETDQAASAAKERRSKKNRRSK